MKILVISYLFPNSVYPDFGIFVLNRLKSVSRYCDLIVINPVPWFPIYQKFDRYKDFNKIPEKEFIDGIEVYHPRFFIIPKFFKIFDSISFMFSVLPLAQKIYKSFKFDLIDLHWTYPDILSGKLLSNYFKKKFLISVRGKAALNIFPSMGTGSFYKEKSLRTQVLKFLLPKADAVIALSHELKRLCLDYNVSFDKIEVIPNGVNTDKFFYLDKKASRQKLELPENRKIVLSVGNLIFGKGFDRVLKVLPEIITKYPNVLYCILGSKGAAGDYKNSLQELVHLHNLADFVIFAGQVKHDELVFWYNAADIFCLPSRSEGCPNVLLEALACGCPSIATDVGEVKGFFDQSFMGQIVQGDLSNIKNGLMDMLSNKFDRQEISNYMKNYSWGVCAKQVVNKYSELIKN